MRYGVLGLAMILVSLADAGIAAARELGDTADDPFPVSSLPAEFHGNTCLYEDDYAEMCPYGGSGPDVVYAFTAPVDMIVDISLCESSYDTKIFLYENSITHGNPYECNDDWCTGPNFPQDWPYLSHLEDVLFLEGNTYYIVVTGYVSECGEYVLRIDESTGDCGLEFPLGGIAEGEPDCGDDYYDEYNGGCHSMPHAFQVIEPDHQGISLFGSSGTFLGAGNPKRDSDWYRVTPYGETTLEFTCRADFPVQIYLLDGSEGCGNIVELGADEAPACESATLSVVVPRGVYWLWVGPSLHEGAPCPEDYLMTLDGYFATATGSPTAQWSDSHGLSATCYPNPSSGLSTVRCAIERRCRVTVTIHDVAGRVLRVLTDEWRGPGPAEWSWNGRDESGRPVPAGVYFFGVVAGDLRDSAKILILK